MRYNLACAAPLALTLSCALMTPAFAETVTAASPDGSIVLSVTTDNDGHPIYSVMRKGKLLIGSSMLGFITSDGPTMQRGQKIVGSETASGKET
ncbi:MAG TPA: glycoside hydrolase family 97 N-terminal domain-containing protein, partial [Novosphingobium sp.]|nr:glycoside hydrolase family 97 N-terminal domain-containing protein [Novosphingobium sp.]